MDWLFCLTEVKNDHPAPLPECQDSEEAVESGVCFLAPAVCGVQSVALGD